MTTVRGSLSFDPHSAQQPLATYRPPLREHVNAHRLTSSAPDPICCSVACVCQWSTVFRGARYLPFSIFRNTPSSLCPFFYSRGFNSIFCGLGHRDPTTGLGHMRRDLVSVSQKFSAISRARAPPHLRLRNAKKKSLLYIRAMVGMVGISYYDILLLF